MNILEGLKRLYIVFSVLLVVGVAGTAWADAGRSYLAGGIAALGAAFALWVAWLVLRLGYQRVSAIADTDKATVTGSKFSPLRSCSICGPGNPRAWAEN
jgi:arginine exporter protein ArgO